jgi:sortase A
VTDVRAVTPSVAVAPRRRTAGDVVRALVRGIGQTLITFGIVVLLFCFYELKITNLYTAQEQNRLEDDLAQAWAVSPPRSVPGANPSGPPAVEIGTGLAVLRIPAIDDDFSKVVVNGVGVEELKRGPGHYPGTALPGEVGNVVLSGHRTTYGAPFERFDELTPGAAVVLETRDTWFTYRVTGSEIVSPRAVEVTYPVPGEPGATPTRRLLTMTTCHPKYSAQQRLIVSAELESALPKAQGDPPALTGQA